MPEARMEAVVSHRNHHKRSLRIRVYELWGEDMTRAEWDALSAREKDAIVAGKMMGWSYGFCIPFDGTGYVENRDGTISEFCVKCGKPRGYHDGWPAYTTSWDAMREVVEKIHGHGLYLAMSKPPDRLTWDVRGWNEKTNDTRFCVHAETLPEAVCIAALTALGVIT